MKKELKKAIEEALIRADIMGYDWKATIIAFQSPHVVQALKNEVELFYARSSLDYYENLDDGEQR